MTFSKEQPGPLTISRPNFAMAFVALAIVLGIAFAFYDRASDKHLWPFGLVFLFLLLMPARYVEIDPRARQFVFRRRFVFDAPFGRFEKREAIPFQQIERIASDYDSESGHAARIILKSGEGRRIEGISPERLKWLESVVFADPA
jgi:hypothetical protein